MMITTAITKISVRATLRMCNVANTTTTDTQSSKRPKKLASIWCAFYGVRTTGQQKIAQHL